MRLFFIISIIIFTASSITAQSETTLSATDYMHRTPFNNNNKLKDSAYNKKWFVTTYSGISSSFIFYKGGHATVLSTPITLQLNRKLNNNLYAFASISAAPAYVNFNNAFVNTNISKFNANNNFARSNNFGVYSRVDLGLTYVNDAKTFSISGSIGIEKSSYPLFPYNQINTTKQNPVVYPNR